MEITSLQNPRVKYFVKLREDKKQRRHDGLMLVEGFDEIMLAISAGYKPQTLLTAPELATRQIDFSAAENITVNRAVFEKISYRDNPDGWLAVFLTPKISLEELTLSSPPFIIVAESIEKPGNLGAILRTADAAHVDALIVSNPRADIYNPNVVRASRGTLFTVPTVEASNADTLSFLRRNGIKILAATPQAVSVYTDQNLREPLAVAVGTEDEGLTDFWLNEADIQVKIPMLGKVNSLNVSIATALIVYETLRQRRQ